MDSEEEVVVKEDPLPDHKIRYSDLDFVYTKPIIKSDLLKNNKHNINIFIFIEVDELFKECTLEKDIALNLVKHLKTMPEMRKLGINNLIFYIKIHFR